MGDPAIVGQKPILGVFGRHPALQGQSRRCGWPLAIPAQSRGSSSGSPCATSIWHFTTSTPVTTSVTVCSTWIRGLTSMK